MPSSINIAVLSGWVVVFTLGLIAGFLCRHARQKKSEKRIQELEAEMLRTHAEILRLQEQQTELEEPETTGVKVISLHKSSNGKLRSQSS